MRAFIIRPFGEKEGIDFERVERKLLHPALDRLGITGRTTGEILSQGNIRADMFRRLLVADLVIADLSIHNANVFYELGIRHALRDKRSFLVKSTDSSVPFDIATDRYFFYDARKPSKRLDDLVAALDATINSLATDSPVFQLVPKLRPADAALVNVVPFDFREEVEQAASRGAKGVLQLLAEETTQFDWGIEGLRVIGNVQVDLGDNNGAKKTWEAVQEELPTDIECNTLLSTTYERLGDLTRSDLVLNRLLQEAALSDTDMAYVRALLGRNAKSRWTRDWQEIEDPNARREAALRSPHLEMSVKGYADAFTEDRNHCYSGINALAQVTILTELASSLPAIWAERFADDHTARIRTTELSLLRDELCHGVKLAVDSALLRERRHNVVAGWAAISRARLLHLTSNKSTHVAHSYKEALASANDYMRDSSRLDLKVFAQLSIRAENADAAIKAIEALRSNEPEPALGPERIVLFVGHRVDNPMRTGRPRFPQDAETVERAKTMIHDAIVKEMEESEKAIAEAKEKGKPQGRLIGLSGGASGGDILFQEVCGKLEIETNLYLALPRYEYAQRSVSESGPEWMERFDHLCSRIEPVVLSESDRLPRWLSERQHYDVLQRSTHWMIHNAFELSPKMTLIALWDGERGHGPGGTHDIVREVTQRGRKGVKFVHLDARNLISSKTTQPHAP